MKLFTKETLTHTSLSQLEVIHRGRGNEGGQVREGRGILLFGFFFWLCFSSWLCFTNQIVQGRQKPARQREAREGQAAGEHIERWEAPPPPPQLEQKTNVT